MLIDPPLVLAVTLFVALGVLEMVVPMTAERGGRGTPWHPHHIAERYSLLTIITIGEVVLGTVLSVSAVVEAEGWSLAAGVVAFGGTALAFGLWWLYFVMPSGRVLSVHRERSFAWGYGHIAIFASIAATGAGLHVAAYAIRDEAHIDDIAALGTVVVPVGLFILALYVIYTGLLRRFDPFHLLLLVATVFVLIAAVVAVAAGASLSVGIAIVALAPIVSIVGYETIGHRHQAAFLDQLGA